MSYKVYKSQNYFVVHDTSTSEDIIRQVRNLVRWEKKGTLYSFYYNTPNLTTVGNAIVRLGTAYEFADLVDSTGTAWVSQSALDLYLEKWTGHICCETSVENLITVNGTDDFTINAGDALDIILTDGTSSVTPVSVTPNAGLNKVDIVLPAATTPSPRSTATLMKTGQTVSYATDDDGMDEYGRDANFLTLDSAPLHNDGSPTLNTTTNRFTDVLGGQTYTNTIVLDWSTWNGTTLKAYRRTKSSGYQSWANAMASVSALTIGGFTGWKLPNRNELENLINEGVTTTCLNYAPFNITVDTNLWSSTTAFNNTANARVMSSTGNGHIGSFGKTSVAAEYIPCRTMTLSTSNVLS